MAGAETSQPGRVGPERGERRTATFLSLRKQRDSIESTPRDRLTVVQRAQYDEVREKMEDMVAEARIASAFNAANPLLNRTFQEAIEKHHETGDWMEAADCIQSRRADIGDRIFNRVQPIIDGNRNYQPRHQGMGEWYVDRALDRMYAAFMQKAGLDLSSSPHLLAALEPENYEWKLPNEPWNPTPRPAAAHAGDRQPPRPTGPDGPAGPRGPEPPPTPRSPEPSREPDGRRRVELPGNPEEQIKTALRYLDRLEQRANANQLRFKEMEMGRDYTALLDAIETLPDRTGTKNEALSRHLQELYPDGVYMKEKLQLLAEARRRLSDRTVEVLKADGDLVQMGAGGDKPPLESVVTISTTNIRPVDWYVLVHHDELFTDEARGTNSKEIHIPVADAMKIWDEAGKLFDKSIAPGVPRFKDTLNSDEAAKRLQAHIASRVGRKAEELARDIFTSTLSMELWDKDRTQIAGKGDPRDLFHFDEKRRQDFYEKLGPAGPWFTVGTYFTKAHQGEPEGTDHKGDDDYERNPRTDLQRKKLEILRQNRESAVFIYSLKDRARGQLIGDFWESVTAKMEDGKKHQLLQIARTRPDAWKGIPFLRLAEGTYSGYFSYPLVFANNIVGDLKKAGWNPEKDGLATPAFWEGKYRLLNRIEPFCPWFNTKDRGNPDDVEYTEHHLQKIRMKFAWGILWDGSYLAQAESRGTIGKFLDIIGRQGTFDIEDVRRMFNAMESSQFLSLEYLAHLKYEVEKHKLYPLWKARPPRR